jgi:hypothetical protein
MKGKQRHEKSWHNIDRFALNTAMHTPLPRCQMRRAAALLHQKADDP